MDESRAREFVKDLSAVAMELHRACGAPIVIVLAMSAIEGGSVLSACYGPRDGVELATALRFAAKHTDTVGSIHIKEKPKGPRS